MKDKKGLPALHARLLRSAVIVALIGVVGVSVIVFVSLDKRDTATILREVRERASLVKLGLLSTMMATNSQEKVRQTVDSFKNVWDFRFRMIRSEHVRHQHGDREGESPRDQVEKDVLSGALKEYSNLDGSTFRYVMPYTASDECGRCHKDKTGESIEPGMVLGVSEFIMDVSSLRNESLRLTVATVGVVTFLMTIVLFVFYRLFAKHVIRPIELISGGISRLEREDFDISLPEAETAEMELLMRQVGNTAVAFRARKEERERELEKERENTEKIRNFAKKKAHLLGIKDEHEISEIIHRLSDAVVEVEKTGMISRVFPYIHVESKKLDIPNDIALIRPAAIYLTDLIPGEGSNMKKVSVELALEEAITNGMVHGNLEIPSRIKEEDFEKFDSMVRERSGKEPYLARKVTISYEYSGNRAVYTVEDEGGGFDWKNQMETDTSEDFLPHGRGIVIMRTFATSIAYNEKGNRVTLAFDLA